MPEILFEKGKLKKIKKMTEVPRGLRMDVDVEMETEDYERWYTFDIERLKKEFKEENSEKIKEKLSKMSMEELKELTKRNDLLVCTDEAYTIKTAKS